ncbi:hypothetical protein EDC04DRAFT_2609844 [Pisolithus marmoratus]|nr:hypothetical protein EDC04DRAFT_2609844 [Pisolithus marmoratus]
MCPQLQTTFLASYTQASTSPLEALSIEPTDDVSCKRAVLEGCHKGHDGRDVALGVRSRGRASHAGVPAKHFISCILYARRALYERFQTERKVDDVNEAITLHRAALELRPSGHHQRPSSLNRLALCLSSRYNSQGVIVDLEEAVTLGRAALQSCPPDHHNCGTYFCNLAQNLWRRFEKQADMYDLDEAIELHRGILTAIRRSMGLLCFSTRHNNKGLLADLEEAVTLGRAVVELCPPGHRDRAISLYNLACDLQRRFKRRAVARSLDEAIKLHREALALRPSGHPQRLSSLQGLAICLLDRYDNQWSVADLEEAITLGRTGVVFHPPGHPRRAACLRTLSRGVWAISQRQALMPRSGRARSVHQVPLRHHPTSNADAASTFHEFSLHLWDKFRKQSAIADLDEAICLATYALELRLPKHSDYAVSVDQLAVLVKEQFRRIDQGTNSNESAMLGQAVDSLCALRHCLRDGFRNQHVTDDLNAANALHRDVLQLRPDGHAHPSYLHDLAPRLIQRFHDKAIAGDLDEAISLEQHALELSVPGDPCYEASKEGLAMCLQMKISTQISQACQVSSTPPVVQNTRLPQLSISKLRQLNSQTWESSSTLCDPDAQNEYKEI